ncbi:MAG: DUF1592 domain-containing protein [Deltaproteobacteria bacterium]|nr:DUF1592 domain-containing protein [Deltaproteobacteria bacterium]
MRQSFLKSLIAIAMVAVGTTGITGCQTWKKKGRGGPASRLATVTVKEISGEDYDRLELSAWPAAASKEKVAKFGMAKGKGAIQAQLPPVKTVLQLDYYKNDSLVLSSIACGDDNVFDLKSGPNPLTIYVCDATGGRFPPIDVGCDRDKPSYGPRLLRLLTAREYQRTIETITGLKTDVTRDFPREMRTHGFDNHEANGLITEAHAEAYYSAAKLVSQQMVKDLGRYMNCPGRDASCVGQFLRGFGRRAWRGPIDQEEEARLTSLYQTGSSFDDGMERLIQGLLMGPRFLYRFELGELRGGYYELSSWEMAQALSYMYWGTSPDDQLIAQAEAGRLTDRSVIAQEAQRLWQDPRAREQLGYFASLWLGADGVLSVNKDKNLFPHFDSDHRQKLLTETKNFFSHMVLDRGGSVADLYQADYTVGDQPLAAIYDGIPTNNGYIRYRSNERSGLLGHASILATFAGNEQSEPIKRGVFVLDRLLCQSVPPPPTSLQITPPPRDPNATVRERFAKHSQDEACALCHQRIDGIGFGMEDMDAVGRLKKVEAGRNIDAQGQVFSKGGAKTEFWGTAGLSRYLATSPQAEICVSKQVYRYAAGHDDDQKSACAVKDLDRAFVDGGRRVSNIFLTVPTLDAFRRRQP